MPYNRSSSAFLLLITALAAPLSRYARGHEEPICSSSLDIKAQESSIRVFESPDHAALCNDWTTSRKRPGRIDTHQCYVPRFYADYLENYSATLITYADSNLLPVLSVCAVVMVRFHTRLQPSSVGTCMWLTPHTDDTSLHLPWGTISWTSGSALGFMDRSSSRYPHLAFHMGT